MNRLTIIGAAVAALVAAAALAEAPAPAKATAAPVAAAAAAASAAAVLPGITGKDQNANGCVSCHTGDKTLNKLFAKMKHRNVDKKTTTVPDDCRTCHSADGDADPLAEVVHLAHYGKAAKSEFVSKQGGQCLHCHALNLETGAVSNKKGARNW